MRDVRLIMDRNSRRSKGVGWVFVYEQLMQNVFNLHSLAFQFLTWRGWHFGLSIVPFASWYAELKFYARTSLAINWHGVILLKTYPFWCPLFIGLAVALQPACSWKLNNPKLVRNNCSSGVLMVPWLSSSLLPMDLQPQRPRLRIAIVFDGLI